MLGVLLASLERASGWQQALRLIVEAPGVDVKAYSSCAAALAGASEWQLATWRRLNGWKGLI